MFRDRIAGIVMLVFAGATAYLAYGIPMGRSTKPGPGIFPILLSLCIAILALILTLKGSRLPGKTVNKMTDPGMRVPGWKVIYLFCSTFAYVFLLRPIGFIVATWLFLIALKPILSKGWAPVLIGSLLTSIVLFLFFNYLLMVQLPRGILL